MYALLELINNSLRASRERQSTNAIRLSMYTNFDGLKFELTDWGGGFDIQSLPYDIHSNISKISLQDKEFQMYRQRHNYRRFGMGIYLAKKTFDTFNIVFFDHNMKTMKWKAGKTAGTTITLQMLR